MKAALVVNKIKKTINENLIDVIDYIKDASQVNADVILFPETALTGLINVDDPQKDIKLGEEIPGVITDKLCEVARKYEINVAISLFEVEGNKLYDTAIFINRKGEIALKYRRMSKGWHDPKLVDSIYCEGESIDVYDTDFGKVCFLICGDLFEGELVKRVADLQVDYLLFPFARSFYDGQSNLGRWKDEVFAEYIRQIKSTGTTTLASNYIDEHCFGGAFVVNAEGDILAQRDLMKEGILIVDLI